MIEYELVRARRAAASGEARAGTGPERLPAIELEDGTWYREESADMARAFAPGRCESRRETAEAGLVPS